MAFEVDGLAIFGGRPAFREKLYVGRPNIGNVDRLLGRIHDLLHNRWLTNDGPLLREFESRVAETLRVKHCIAVCNATVGLEITIRALGMTGEVIIPSFTFIATAHALRWQGTKPVFCDIDPRTYNLDPTLVERMITPQTTGIIGVHLWGRPCQVEALAEIAHRRRLKLLFDAAHAFSASYRHQPIGNFGDAEVFSFHTTKFINSFEGGAITTNNDELAAKIRLMRNFGFDGYDKVVYLGTNGKMTEVAAAMGLTSLESLSEFTAVNHHNYLLYLDELKHVPGLALLKYNKVDNCNYQYVVLEVDEQATHISRDRLQQILWAENIIVRRYFYPGCHRMEPYRSDDPAAGARLPVTESLCERVLCLPTGTTITPAMIKEVCRIIRLAVFHSQEIKKRWPHEAQN